jgi:hypothetical protein
MSKFWSRLLSLVKPVQPTVHPRTVQTSAQRIAIRNQKLLFLAQEHPRASLNELGIMVGLTRERVRQILQDLGHSPLKNASGRQPSDDAKAPCLQCHQPVPRVGQEYCSRKCYGMSRRNNAFPVALVCTHCSIVFYKTAHQEMIRASGMRKGLYKSDHRFCSQLCANRHNGEARRGQWPRIRIRATNNLYQDQLSSPAWLWVREDRITGARTQSSHAVVSDAVEALHGGDDDAIRAHMLDCYNNGRTVETSEAFFYYQPLKKN